MSTKPPLALRGLYWRIPLAAVGAAGIWIAQTKLTGPDTGDVIGDTLRLLGWPLFFFGGLFVVVFALVEDARAAKRAAEWAAGAPLRAANAKRAAEAREALRKQQNAERIEEWMRERKAKDVAAATADKLEAEYQRRKRSGEI